MKIIIVILTLSSVVFTTTLFAAGDIEAGQALSTQCSACHGNEGMSLSEQWPNIAGQKEAYLVAQLTKFKTGERSDPLMSAIVGPLDEQNILDLSAFYASNSAIARFSFESQTLSIPYLEVDGATFEVGLSLDSIDDLIFSVTSLSQH